MVDESGGSAAWTRRGMLSAGGAMFAGLNSESVAGAASSPFNADEVERPGATRNTPFCRKRRNVVWRQKFPRKD